MEVRAHTAYRASATGQLNSRGIRCLMQLAGAIPKSESSCKGSLILPISLFCLPGIITIVINLHLHWYTVIPPLEASEVRLILIAIYCMQDPYAP